MSKNNEGSADTNTRGIVREEYGKIARQGGSCCEPSSCCGSPSADSVATTVGYSDEELAGLPDGANMGLSCGNPTAIASLRPGEVVLDLGAGGGFDIFIAARKVGPSGRAIGVDMTPDMVDKARRNAESFRKSTDLDNVEFRLGEIEHLPVADDSVDVIISNCVINLSPDKAQVFTDAYRVLRDGGRLAVSDIVATEELPSRFRSNRDALCGCVAGAALVSDLERMLSDAGFVEVRVTLKEASRAFIKDWFPGSGVEEFVLSANIEAAKPNCAGKCCT